VAQDHLGRQRLLDEPRQSCRHRAALQPHEVTAQLMAEGGVAMRQIGLRLVADSMATSRHVVSSPEDVPAAMYGAVMAAPSAPRCRES
jgi:hypothetical protein